MSDEPRCVPPASGRKPLRRKSRKKAKADRELARSWEVVRKRSGGWCEFGHVEAMAPHRADHVHHIKPRSKGGTHAPSNLLAICASGHDYIHMVDPKWARKNGWLI